MKLKNNSARAYHVRDVIVAPGATATVPDAAEKDIEGIDDLEIVGGKAIDEDKSMTKAELQAALTEKGVDYPSTANKAELQDLHDAS